MNPDSIYEGTGDVFVNINNKEYKLKSTIEEFDYSWYNIFLAEIDDYYIASIALDNKEYIKPMVENIFESENGARVDLDVEEFSFIFIKNNDNIDVTITKRSSHGQTSSKH